MWEPIWTTPVGNPPIEKENMKNNPSSCNATIEPLDCKTRGYTFCALPIGHPGDHLYYSTVRYCSHCHNSMERSSGLDGKWECCNLKCSTIPFGQEKQTNPLEGQEKVFPGGASSSKCSSFRLIPFVAIQRLADRCQLGLDRKGNAAWNAMNPNAAQMLDDIDWVINRYEHAIKHSYLAIAKLKGLIPDDGDDDAAAVMWAGMLGIAADDRRKNAAGQTGKATTEKRD